MNKKLLELRERCPWKKKQKQEKGRASASTFNPPLSKKHDAEMKRLREFEFQHRLTFER